MTPSKRVDRPISAKGGWSAAPADRPWNRVHSGHRLRCTILLTDGQANVGMVDPAQLAHHAANLRMLGVTTTTLGFGEHFDEQLLSAMAEGGGGTEYIRSPQQVNSLFQSGTRRHAERGGGRAGRCGSRSREGMRAQ
ncbi:MAG: VWA domain-containing protein [Thermomicrobiales bacterium]